jgi:hypothetical protein
MNSFASSKRTNPVDLPAHLRDPLISYTAAAGAALSVAAQAAEAKVVYVPTSVDVTNGYGIDIGGTRVLTFRTVSFGNADGNEIFYAAARDGVISAGKGFPYSG